jgi:adenylate kinase
VSERVFTQAEVDAIVARRVAKERRRWERERVDEIRRAVEMAIAQMRGSQ